MFSRCPTRSRIGRSLISVAESRAVWTRHLEARPPCRATPPADGLDRPPVEVIEARYDRHFRTIGRTCPIVASGGRDQRLDHIQVGAGDGGGCSTTTSTLSGRQTLRVLSGRALPALRGRRCVRVRPSPHRRDASRRRTGTGRRRVSYSRTTRAAAGATSSAGG